MKLQEIIRNGSRYYHVYLPKNIIENVLHWKGKDNLIYRVINETLVLKKDLELPNEWQEHMRCKICYNPTIIIKIIKNFLHKNYTIVARCPLDHTILKTFLPADHFNEWKTIILSQIFTCDICNGTLLEEKRKFVRSNVSFRVRVKLFCRDCGRHRIKVLAQEIWDELHLQDITSPIPQSFLPVQKKSILHCPTCEESISPDQSFCGQCGTCLIK